MLVDRPPEESLKKWMSRVERDEIEIALRRAGGNVSRAAEGLQCDLRTLWRKIGKLGIDQGSFR